MAIGPERERRTEDADSTRPSAPFDRHPLVLGGLFLLGSLVAGASTLVARSLFPAQEAAAAMFGFGVLSLLAAAAFLVYAQYEQARGERERLEQC